MEERFIKFASAEVWPQKGSHFKHYAGLDSSISQLCSEVDHHPGKLLSVGEETILPNEYFLQSINSFSLYFQGRERCRDWFKCLAQYFSREDFRHLYHQGIFGFNSALGRDEHSEGLDHNSTQHRTHTIIILYLSYLEGLKVHLKYMSPCLQQFPINYSLVISDLSWNSCKYVRIRSSSVL